MGIDSDTITAVATAPGRGGIGIVRLSGPSARAIGERLAGRRLKPRFAHLVTIRDCTGEPLDDAIAIAFDGPASFTGEDVVELQGHGGPAVLERVLAACLTCGARLARPGEFSERAFLNDRMDLAQAEAIADLIDANSAQAASAAMRSLRGEFSARVRSLMNGITNLRVYVEAAIDFPDEDVDFISDGDVLGRIETIRSDARRVLDTARQGVLLADGMTVVLAGAPNAGKSSLLNALARRDAAIVAELPGTTRDVLRERIDLDGMPLHVIDTAGLRVTRDPVEAEGVRRARVEIQGADALLFVIDLAMADEVPVDRADLQRIVGVELPPAALVILNKTDLTGAERVLQASSLSSIETVAISAHTGDGMNTLVSALEALAGYSSEEASAFTARARHVEALTEADAALAQGVATLKASSAGDLVAEDLRRAHDALGRILGEVTPDDLLGEIFSSFCIGK